MTMADETSISTEMEKYKSTETSLSAEGLSWEESSCRFDDAEEDSAEASLTKPNNSSSNNNNDDDSSLMRSPSPKPVYDEHGMLVQPPPALRYRRSRFIEGSMHDRVSERPPSIFLYHPGCRPDDDDNDGRGKRLEKRSSGIFRFGKALASAFQPKTTVKTEEEKRKEELKQRQIRAEKAYAELKKKMQGEQATKAEEKPQRPTRLSKFKSLSELGKKAIPSMPTSRPRRSEDRPREVHDLPSSSGQNPPKQETKLLKQVSNLEEKLMRARRELQDLKEHYTAGRGRATGSSNKKLPKDDASRKRKIGASTGTGAAAEHGDHPYYRTSAKTNSATDVDSSGVFHRSKARKKTRDDSPSARLPRTRPRQTPVHDNSDACPPPPPIATTAPDRRRRTPKLRENSLTLKSHQRLLRTKRSSSNLRVLHDAAINQGANINNSAAEQNKHFRSMNRENEENIPPVPPVPAEYLRREVL